MLKAISAGLLDFAVSRVVFALRILLEAMIDYKSCMIRMNTIQGEWSGFVTQYDLDNREFGFAVHVNLNTNWRSVCGQLTYDDPESRFEMALEGRFAHQDNLESRYRNKRSGTKHFGQCVLCVSPDGNAMRGKFVGHGIAQDRIVTGDIALVRRR